MPTEDDLKGPIVPGHPLYAWWKGMEIVGDACGALGVPNGHDVAASMFARLAANDPPILLCTPEEMKD